MGAFIARRITNATAALCCSDWETVPSYKYRSDVDTWMQFNLSRRNP
ncbi:hypothetical protein ACB303_25605 [Citrobacter farmeri]